MRWLVQNHTEINQSHEWKPQVCQPAKLMGIPIHQVRKKVVNVGEMSIFYPSVHTSIHPFLHLLTRPFIHPSTHLYIHSPTHPSIHSAFHPSTDSFIPQCIDTSTDHCHAFIHSCLHSSTHLFISRSLLASPPSHIPPLLHTSILSFPHVIHMLHFQIANKTQSLPSESLRLSDDLHDPRPTRLLLGQCLPRLAAPPFGLVTFSPRTARLPGWLSP